MAIILPNQTAASFSPTCLSLESTISASSCSCLPASYTLCRSSIGLSISNNICISTSNSNNICISSPSRSISMVSPYSLAHSFYLLHTVFLKKRPRMPIGRILFLVFFFLTLLKPIAAGEEVCNTSQYQCGTGR